MKRFLAFYGMHYYPAGGMDDFVGDFETKQEAVDHLEDLNKDKGWKYEWAHVYDAQLKTEVFCK